LPGLGGADQEERHDDLSSGGSEFAARRFLAEVDFLQRWSKRLGTAADDLPADLSGARRLLAGTVDEAGLQALLQVPLDLQVLVAPPNLDDFGPMVAPVKAAGCEFIAARPRMICQAPTI